MPKLFIYALTLSIELSKVDKVLFLLPSISSGKFDPYNIWLRAPDSVTTVNSVVI